MSDPHHEIPDEQYFPMMEDAHQARTVLEGLVLVLSKAYRCDATIELRAKAWTETRTKTYTPNASK